MTGYIRIGHANGKVAGGETTIYCGRRWAGRTASVLGNPYRVTEHSGDTLPKYRAWLWSEMNRVATTEDGTTAARRELERLATMYRENAKLVLQCWCGDDSPTCHCNVIRKAVVWLAGDKKPKPVDDEAAGREYDDAMNHLARA